MPRRPARPVSWVYSPGVMSACASPFHLPSFSSTTERAGMLMPSASVSVANTTLTRPRDEQLLDDLLEGRQHARVVGGDPALSASSNSWYPSTPRSSSGRSAVRSAQHPLISSRSDGLVSRSPDRRHCSIASSQPLREKMK